jgi:hypothetical protein
MDDEYDVNTAGNGTGVYEAGCGSGAHEPKETAANTGFDVNGGDSTSSGYDVSEASAGSGEQVHEGSLGTGELVSSAGEGTGEQVNEGSLGTGEQILEWSNGTGEQAFGDMNGADLSIDLGGDMSFDPAADSVGGMDVIL